MKLIHGVVVSLMAILSSATLIHAQDLSKYRDFSLRMSLADVTRQVNKQPTVATGLIQELTWWPPQPLGASLLPESVQQVRFSFYNSELYKIAVTYDAFATKGLTAADMVRTMSQNYGPATKPAVGIKEADSATDETLAHWEDSQYSVDVVQLSFSNTFGLVMFVRALDAQVEIARIEAEKLERQEAPQKEFARARKATDDLEIQRQKSLKTFHP